MTLQVSDASEDSWPDLPTPVAAVQTWLDFGGEGAGFSLPYRRHMPMGHTSPPSGCRAGDNLSIALGEERRCGLFLFQSSHMARSK